jgi:dGTPase
VPDSAISDARKQRRYEQSPPKGEYRNAFERDRDRLLYSSAFRRLAGVTQVAAVSEKRLLHNRLTHSLKVGQIGRRIAQRLLHPEFGKPQIFKEIVQLSPDVVEAAGLAHDLGHPPFGHIAEGALEKNTNDVCGGFEGNAQSFRIVTKLAVRRQHPLGLDLTRATLNSILKYPQFRADRQKASAGVAWTDRSRGSKWGAYDSDAADFQFAREGALEYIRSTESILMDWADDVSFATHDIDDYFRAGLIPLHDLQRNATYFITHATARLTKKHNGFDAKEFHKAFEQICKNSIAGPYTGTREDRQALHDFISVKISDFISAVEDIPTPPYVRISKRSQYEVEVLKELTWYHVIENSALATLQEGQTKLINQLYNILYEWLQADAKSPRIPLSLREMYLSIEDDVEMSGKSAEYVLARTVSDYICSLTEDQALDMYERMSGVSRSSIFGAWFH